METELAERDGLYMGEAGEVVNYQNSLFPRAYFRLRELNRTVFQERRRASFPLLFTSKTDSVQLMLLKSYC